MVAVTVVLQLGSSPHTWRTQLLVGGGAVEFRIISTYVDNTVCILSAQQGIWDHLHIRGEHAIEKWREFFVVGSSPHTWRTQNREIAFQTVDGIISTYVENTRFLFVKSQKILGSSPHTWRTHKSLLSTASPGRIISTYVENTCCFLWSDCNRKDHLHIRGEHAIMLLLMKMD